MDFGRSDRWRLPTAIKILIAGGFGAGKTTMVTAVSETRPLRTEEILTQIGQHIDDLAGIEGKPTTTVAFDFGRITISGDYMLYLFGTPGQERFWFVWDDLNLGALGAVVLADTRRLADCFPAIDYFEQRDTPFVVALNCFDGAREFTVGEVRQALNLEPEIPIVMTDARRRDSGREVLITLVEHAMRRGATPVGTMS
ncbi:GTP-binding protein [Nonomuraea rhodomycinica]|uniref:ATP/GTP-binding protein n=1 Tax=Nonomuraea rhodomycinica TaxID=1712872 RepID=A0A7Y6IPP4_9ACTN|nr:ATP/GTP-binding protein [Nonomuraea rhodomycinica]NUW41796.1 ATP/GTP-binding protein [Nonomuraea rhodomycinica]